MKKKATGEHIVQVSGDYTSNQGSPWSFPPTDIAIRPTNCWAFVCTLVITASTVILVTVCIISFRLNRIEQLIIDAEALTPIEQQQIRMAHNRIIESIKDITRENSDNIENMLNSKPMSPARISSVKTELRNSENRVTDKVHASFISTMNHFEQKITFLLEKNAPTYVPIIKKDG